MKKILLSLALLGSTPAFALDVQSRVFNGNVFYYHTNNKYFAEVFEEARDVAIEIVRASGPIEFELADGRMLKNFLDLLLQELQDAKIGVFKSSLSLFQFKNDDLTTYRNDYDDCHRLKRMAFVLGYVKDTLFLCKFISAFPIELQAQIIIHEAIHLLAVKSDDFYIGLIGSEQNTSFLEMWILRNSGYIPYENAYIHSGITEKEFKKISFKEIPGHLLSVFARKKLNADD